MPVQPSNAGIVTDSSGERHIPESTRADGSVRKAIKIRPGYRPPEDAEIYKNRTAETFRNRYKGGVVGAEASTSSASGNAADSNGNGTPASSSAAANKNAKRREARKKAKAAGEDVAPNDKQTGDSNNSIKGEATSAPEAAIVDPEAERKKKARNLTKKLKQAKELKSKKDDGESLLPEQFAKVIKINELVRELAALGFDNEGEPIEAGERAGNAIKDGKKDEAPA
ncbi:hypothetical protein BD289DRAFT_478459 [Coniella lustricola]|uniref:WIBG Mago-binding domain-containing protein n=1 Tax=Coniella lustricola TaxID=2025994 RepID=A0A2T3AMI8_9PEZI|nr:hypothetical protein BD289DRAFT_478459 [Coniella lustricola]